MLEKKKKDRFHDGRGTAAAKLSKWPNLGAACFSLPTRWRRTTRGIDRSTGLPKKKKKNQRSNARYTTQWYERPLVRYFVTGYFSRLGLGLNPRTQPQTTIGTFRRRGSESGRRWGGTYRPKCALTPCTRQSSSVMAVNSHFERTRNPDFSL